MAVLVNHYSVLGLASTTGPNLTDEEISKAFKRMALRLHPDKNPHNPNAHSSFQKLLSSYEVLKNPISRKEFDRLLQLQQQAQNHHQNQHQHQNHHQNQPQPQPQNHHQSCNKRQRDEQEESSKKSPRQPVDPKMPSEPPKEPSFTKKKFVSEFDRISKLVAQDGLQKLVVNEGYHHIRLF
ncbi:dnaJ homolog subfamily C member 10 [Ricinus communis]|uniref:dnaJ homolog subfamily C member 10 n=1 Tax=Ricinus communis TaxID=3988 RepID=UPI00201A54E6|nr:dnaJ homolog subfamily C member 10 [Ricinus communis]